MTMTLLRPLLCQVRSYVLPSTNCSFCGPVMTRAGAFWAVAAPMTIMMSAAAAVLKRRKHTTAFISPLTYRDEAPHYLFTPDTAAKTGNHLAMTSTLVPTGV